MNLDLDDLDGELLLDLAFASIGESLGQAAPATSPTPAWLQAPAACFVTLEFGERLHGCIGTIEPYQPLVDNLRRNAQRAALEDPRSRPLRVDELALVDLSVAVLGPLGSLSFRDEHDARKLLRPGIDGLLLTWRGRRGVFLPKVWDKLPDTRDFLDQLKRKAGLATEFWAPDVVLERFEVRSFTRLSPTP